MTATPLPPEPAPLLPPDEKFWQRHSPHHEFPFSTAATVAIHLFVFFLIVLAIGVRGCSAEHSGSLPITSVIVDGGNDVPGAAPGNRDDGKHRLSIEGRDLPSLPDVRSPQIPPVDASTPIDPSAENRVSPAPGPTTARDLDELIGQALARGGKGPRTGPGGGKPGAVIDPIRVKRVQRWVMQFNYGNSAEYVRQMQLLGAEIGFITTGDHSRIEMARDLSQRPVQLKSVSVATINRVFWRDNNAQSVKGICAVLGVPVPEPLRFYAFMPEKLEKSLLEKEMAIGRRNGRDSEAKIRETVFAISFVKDKPVIVVIEQTGVDGKKTILKPGN